MVLYEEKKKKMVPYLVDPPRASLSLLIPRSDWYLELVPRELLEARRLINSVTGWPHETPWQVPLACMRALDGAYYTSRWGTRRRNPPMDKAIIVPPALGSYTVARGHKQVSKGIFFSAMPAQDVYSHGHNFLQINIPYSVFDWI